MSDDNEDGMAGLFAASRFAAGCRVDMSALDAEEIAFAKRERLAQLERERKRRDGREPVDGSVGTTVAIVAGEVDKGAKAAAADLAIEPGPER